MGARGVSRRTHAWSFSDQLILFLIIFSVKEREREREKISNCIFPQRMIQPCLIILQIGNKWLNKSLIRLNPN